MLAGLVLAAPCLADEPWLLAEALATPVWLELTGETRVRFESLDGQFRAGGSGGDQQLALRTLVFAGLGQGSVRGGVELQDSRAYLVDSGSPLSQSMVNPLDVLQAWVLLELPFARRPETVSELRLGRMTLGIGSGRQVERFEFANVLTSFTGVHYRGVLGGGHELQAFYTAPVDRRPRDRDGLESNRHEWNREEWGRRFWGVHYRHAELLGTRLPRFWAELFVYGLDESDRRGVPTPNRNYLTPGFRLFRVPNAGSWDWEIETAWRFGSRRATADPGDVDGLDVRARMLFAAVGYAFDHPWRPRIAIEHYYASGDRNPDDGRFDQYEFLFGGRRTDLGQTGIHGPLVPANLRAPGLRLEARPSPRLDGRLVWKVASLAEACDAWVAAGVRDPAGRSGRFIGHTLDGRFRYWMIPNSLRVEAGASAILRGRFAKQAPNAAHAGNTRYGYVQLTAYF
jgi:hypothetical protein